MKPSLRAAPSSAPLPVMLAVTGIESFTTSLVEFGLFFYLAERYAFTDTQNLLVALGFGVGYTLGGWQSHTLTQRFGERRALAGFLITLFILNLVLGLQPGDQLAQPALLLAMIALNALIGLGSGLKWPVIETYVTAGRPPRQTSRALGLFNLTWAFTLILAIAPAGLIIEHAPAAVFLLPAVLTLITLGLLTKLPAQPDHLEHDDPQRPDPHTINHYQRLTRSARASLTHGMLLLFLVNPLFPGIFQRFGVHVAAATFLATPLHITRLAFFAWMQRADRWHGKRLGLCLTAWAIPLGCAAIVFGPTLELVLLGQAVMGAGLGYAYYAALYYALITHNASVEAGGQHEALIGAGFTLGPLLGLAGTLLGGTTGLALLTAPVAAGCVFISLKPLRPTPAPPDRPA